VQSKGPHDEASGALKGAPPDPFGSDFDDNFVEPPPRWGEEGYDSRDLTPTKDWSESQSQYSCDYAASNPDAEFPQQRGERRELKLVPLRGLGKSHQPALKQRVSTKWEKISYLHRKRKVDGSRGNPPGLPGKKVPRRAPAFKLACEVWNNRTSELRSFTVPDWFIETSLLPRWNFRKKAKNLKLLERMRTLLTRMNFIEFMKSGGSTLHLRKYAGVGLLTKAGLAAALRKSSRIFFIQLHQGIPRLT